MSDPSTSGDDAPDAERKIRRALAQIRREGWKAAAIYAVADATLATLLVNLAATLFGVPVLPARLPIPDPVLSALGDAGVSIADPTVASGAVVGAAVGGLVFVAEVGLRVRRPLVEQFEAVNPSLRESLRTARDAVQADRRSAIVLRLYEDVLADLREASSIGLLDLRRVAVTLLLISAVSVATIQVAVTDVRLAGIGGPPDTERTRGGGTSAEYTGLRDGSSILGEPEDVPTGEEELEATIDTSGTGSGDGAGTDSAAAYDDSGFSDSTAIESQRAGFRRSENLENAELIREYNLRIRQDSEE
ncbi:MAG: hypothetical protein ABEI80_08540 [Haloplanus sp.]